MTRSNNIDEVQRLASEILKHKQWYYAGKPRISDEHFDQLEEQLRALDPQHPVLDVVGMSVSNGTTKAAHAAPMLSLEKTYDPKTLVMWQKDRPVMGMLKIDGNSLSLVYEDGRLNLAKTRGNGRIGEIVTDKIIWVGDIPQRIKKQGRVEVRGELFCREQQFLELVEAFRHLDLEVPTNPRNTVAGLLGRKNHIHLCSYFNFFAFDLLHLDETPLDVSTEEQKFAELAQLGFALPNPKLCSNDTEVSNYLQYAQEQMEVGEFAIDGAVFSFNELALHAELGETAHHPRYKLSFKWQGKTAESTIERIDWFTSRLGIVTPVAVIEPVNLSGAQITNVTLHNAAHVRTLNLKVGDRIELVRSGEVIPKYLQTLVNATGSYVWPETCPACAQPLIFDDVRLICQNQTNCPAQQSGKILNWIRCTEIDDLSEKRLSQLMAKGLVHTIPDLYRLSLEDLLSLPQTKEKLATKLLSNINRSRTLPLANFLNGLGISGTGFTSWEKLLQHFPSLEALTAAQWEDIAKVDGFAEKSAQQIKSGLTVNMDLINELLSLGIQVTVPTTNSNADGPFSGKQFVITGSLSEPRATVEKRIKAAGGSVSSAVSSKTYALVTNDTDTTSSKMQKAQKLNIPILSEKALYQLIDEN